jgi:hypothetical protein
MSGLPQVKRDVCVDPGPKAGVTINEIYKEQYAHFRAMNDILYKIPPLFTVVIGSLWSLS